MLAGLDKEHKERLHLKDASHYKYLVGGGVTTCEGRDDAEEFAEIRSAMKVLEMTDQDIWDVLKILASILHLGNLRYKVEEGGERGEAANIPEQANVERAAHFLGLNKQDLLRFAVNSLIIALIISLQSSHKQDHLRSGRDGHLSNNYRPVQRCQRCFCQGNLWKIICLHCEGKCR